MSYWWQQIILDYDKSSLSTSYEQISALKIPKL